MNNSQEILMSPILSQKFEKIDNKINNLHTKLTDVENKLSNLISQISNVNSFLENNRELYINLLKSINSISIENKSILEKNSQLYNQAMTEFKLKEKNEKIMDIFNNITKNNKIIENNITSPLCESRIYNRFWRINHLEKQQKLCDLINERKNIKKKKTNKSKKNLKI